MSLWKQITSLVKDPPPSHVFELSDAGVAYSIEGRTGFERFAPGTLAASPLEDNLLNAGEAAAVLQRIAPAGGNKRRPAAVILPDQAARVSILDFDNFPSAREEQEALVRFRIKKTIPFDIEAARISFFPLPSVSGRSKTDVLAVTVSMEILARYEALFRSASFHPGEITTSSLAALDLYKDPGVALIIKATGTAVTLIAVADGRPRLYRCVDLEAATDQEMLDLLHRTFVFVEDEVGQPVSKLILCGVDKLPAGIELPSQPLVSRAGNAAPYNAGLLGYLEAKN